jgi:hypothetical protein
VTIEAWALEKAIRRYWWRNPREEGRPFVRFPEFVQNFIISEALEIQEAK